MGNSSRVRTKGAVGEWIDGPAPLPTADERRRGLPLQAGSRYAVGPWHAMYTGYGWSIGNENDDSTVTVELKDDALAITTLLALIKDHLE